MLLVPFETCDVVSDTFVPSICSVNVINGSQMADVLVCELLDDIPYKLPVEVHKPCLATSLRVFQL